MVRHKTKGKRFGNEVCWACESSLQPKQNGLTCTKCHTRACSMACGRAVVDLHCCRLTGVVSHECIHHNHSEGLGGSAAEGTPRMTQSQGQRDQCPGGGYAVRSTIPKRTRGPPGCTAGGAYHPPHHAGRAHGGRDGTADAG